MRIWLVLVLSLLFAPTGMSEDLFDDLIEQKEQDRSVISSPDEQDLNEPSVVSNPDEQEAIPPYKCCILKIQEFPDAPCGGMDRAMCESSSVNGTEGDPTSTTICAWNRWEKVCENLHANECSTFSETEGCNYTDTYYVQADNIDIPISSLPSECYGVEAEISEQYCGHGVAEMCEDYISQVDNLIPPTVAGQPVCIDIGSPACLLFQNQEEALTLAQGICEQARSNLGNGDDWSISISGNQCNAIMDSSGLDLAEFSTPLSFCITSSGVTTTYPTCSATCAAGQAGQSIECVENAEDEVPITHTCCWNGLPISPPRYIWKDGSSCDDNTNSDTPPDADYDSDPGADYYSEEDES